MATTDITTVSGSTRIEVTVDTEDLITYGTEVYPNHALNTLVRATMVVARGLGFTTTDLHDAVGKQIAVDEERRVHG